MLSKENTSFYLYLIFFFPVRRYTYQRGYKIQILLGFYIINQGSERRRGMVTSYYPQKPPPQSLPFKFSLLLAIRTNIIYIISKEENN